MSTIDLEASLSDDLNRIEIDEGDGHQVVISVMNDIDLTRFVERLAELLPTNVELSLDTSSIQTEDKKIKLVLDTVRAIVEKFNEGQKPTEPDGDPYEDDIPF